MVSVFQNEQAQNFVDSIMLGYNNYLELRIDRKKNMEVSGGFAWTKANYIDDAVAKANLSFVSSHKLKMAGQTWEYLEFDTHTGYGRSLVMLKAEVRLKQVFGKTATKKSKYIYDKAEINRRYIKKDSSIHSNVLGQMYLEIPFEDLELPKEILSEFDSFLVVTYEADTSNKGMLSSIKVCMLNPIDEGIMILQDLTPFIFSSTIEPIDISEELLEEISSDVVPIEEFNIVPFEKEKTV